MISFRSLVIASVRYAWRTGVAAVLLTAVTVLAASPASYASSTPAPVQVHQNVVYGKSAKGLPLTADVYSPAGRTKPAPVVIVVHGGGFNAGSKQGTDQYAQALASAGFVTVNVNYTLATKGSPGYPEQVQEIRRAVQWSVAHASQYGGNPHRLALLGFSAGGYLVAMAGLLDSSLSGRPIKAVVTLSALLDLPALDQTLRARIAACGFQTSCPQMPEAPQPAAAAPLWEFLGCKGPHCSPRLLKNASPSSHVSGSDPSFLIFNSANELIPRSQATDMGHLLRAARVPEKVVIVQGSNHGASYLPQVSPAILYYLGQKLGTTPLRLAPVAKPAGSTGTSLTLLVVICALVVAGGLGAVVLAMRRRTAGHR